MSIQINASDYAVNTGSKMMKHLIIAVLLLAGAARAAEEVTVPALVIKTGVNSNVGDFVVGYRFTLDFKPMTVTALGITDQNKDGKLNEPEPVKVAIWDTTGKQLLTAEVPLTATAENGAFYVAIEPVKLDAGSYVIGAVTHAGGEGVLCDLPIEALPGVRWDEGRYEMGAALVFPQQKREEPSSYFGPVFKVLGSAARVTQPKERAIFQRDEHGVAGVPVAVTIPDGLADTIEVRAIDRQTKATVKDWAKVTAGMKLTLPAGWYQLEFRATKAGSVVTTTTVERVGVGELFVTCGQSNSANYGGPRQKAQDDRVSSCNFQTGLWQHGDDPQPVAGGKGGSPWALMGDLLAKRYDVPVGFICVGVGSTSVGQWTPPTGACYPKLKQALQLAGTHGCRAVLWHQGESDSIAGTSAENYAKMLGEVIAQSRKDAGWDVPWGVALASFHPAPEATPERQAAVVAGQQKVIATVSGVFQGPETDSFHTRGFLADSVHFNAQGLAAHAQGWADALTPLMQTQAKPKP
ncbi:MAG: hypothetical protein NTV93_17205 [Verrucomicrobia bacterium]|nr:hypothetical protein [Verrucomicrobiota bacterium]